MSNANQHTTAILELEEKEDRYLMALYQISNSFIGNFNIQKLVEQLIDIVLATFRTQTCLLMLKDLQLHSLRPIAIKNTEGKVPLKHTNKYITFKELKVIYHKKRTILWRKDLESRIMLGAPMIQHNKVIGFLIMEAHKEQKFVKQDLHLFSGIALLIANGITSIQKYLDSKDHLKKLEALNDSTLKLSFLLNRKDIYREAVKEACNILCCTKSSIVVLENDCLQIGHAIGIEKEHLREAEIKIGEGLIGTTVATGNAIISHELPPSLSPSGRDKYKTNSFVIVPIVDPSREQKVIGALCVTDRLNKIPFSNNDKKLLTFLAGQIGIALTNAGLFENATIDHLTKLYLRGHLFEKLEEALHYPSPCALLMIDLDRFKSINDTYGHQIGDVILQELGKLLKDFVRENDIAGRYGGEEFLILLQNIECLTAVNIAERIRAKIANFVFNQKHIPLKLTASIGVAQHKEGETLENLVLRADKAMYVAKKNGRNKVCQDMAKKLD